jgi:DNA-binding FrmR family transcriptional regulator
MVPPSNEALRQVIERDSDLVDVLNEFYGDAAADGGLDKVERELLLDLLARHFTGQSWPRTGGMDTTRRFMAALQRAMSAAGWKVDGFAVAA